MSHQPSHTVSAPSETVAPTRVDTAPQQGSTMPGDGSEVKIRGSVDSHDPNVNVVEVPGDKLSWKDQVLGYAKSARGTVTGNAETKEKGQKILAGEVKPVETHKKDV